jgi:hypothetical protein
MPTTASFAGRYPFGTTMWCHQGNASQLKKNSLMFKE